MLVRRQGMEERIRLMYRLVRLIELLIMSWVWEKGELYCEQKGYCKAFFFAFFCCVIEHVCEEDFLTSRPENNL